MRITPHEAQAAPSSNPSPCAVPPQRAHEPVPFAKALEFLGRQKKEKPFFLYFPLTGPHEPWVPTEEFRGKSKAGPYGDYVQQMDATLGQIMKALDEAMTSSQTTKGTLRAGPA